MSYSKKITNIVIKHLVVFIAMVFGLPVYANSLSDMINSISGSESKFCTERNIGTEDDPKIETNCFFPGKIPASGDLIIEDVINWDQDKNLVLHTKGNIIFEKNGKIVNKKSGSIILKAGMEPGNKKSYNSTVIFNGYSQIEMLEGGKIKIYYNPTKGQEKHKYHNHTIYSAKLNQSTVESYMLVNDVWDLQGITACLSCHYALSQDVDASKTHKWSDEKGGGFVPIKGEDNSPFSGSFDGNNYTIKNLYINRPKEDMVGLFGNVFGSNDYRSEIKHFTMDNVFIRGNTCVAVVGHATGVEIFDIHLTKEDIKGNKSGLVTSCVFINNHGNISASSTTDPKKIFGSCLRCKGDEKKGG